MKKDTRLQKLDFQFRTLHNFLYLCKNKTMDFLEAFFDVLPKAKVKSKIYTHFYHFWRRKEEEQKKVESQERVIWEKVIYYKKKVKCIIIQLLLNDFFESNFVCQIMRDVCFLALLRHFIPVNLNPADECTYINIL